ncbi:NUDIX hydrolase [Streptosporangium sp. NPDC004631]
MTTTQPATQCDNLSVGVLITDADGRYLMFERATAPAGIAPPAGHVDDHGDLLTAARNEVAEEVGLTVTGLHPVAGGWRTNRCRRTIPDSGTAGHHWRVYQARQVSGQLAPSIRETRNARWLTVRQLQLLTDRTVAYAHGELDDAAFTSNPGIEPVWVAWLAEAGIVAAGRDDLALVDGLAARPHVAHA